MPIVSVQLLGPFAIHASGRTAGPWRRTSAKWLLELVFLSPKRRVTREVAADTLFGILLRKPPRTLCTTLSPRPEEYSRS